MIYWCSKFEKLKICHIIFVSFIDLYTSQELGQYHDMYQLFYASEFNLGSILKKKRNNHTNQKHFFNISKEITIFLRALLLPSVMKIK